jgi:thiol-disulfide isomerase/thioredoxin
MTSNRAMLNFFRPALAGAVVALLACANAVAAPPTLDLAQYRGRVVVVDFWASWCKPCRQSLPWLNEMRARYGEQGLVIIGVNVDAQRADADRFLRDVPVDFEIIYDAQGALAQQFGLQSMPSSFVYDRDGKLAHTLQGFREARRAEHESQIQTLLAGKS